MKSVAAVDSKTADAFEDEEEYDLSALPVHACRCVMCVCVCVCVCV